MARKQRRPPRRPTHGIPVDVVDEAIHEVYDCVWGVVGELDVPTSLADSAADAAREAVRAVLEQFSRS